MEQKLLARVSAAAASSAGAAVDLDSLQGVFYLDVTAGTGTTPTLDVDIEELDLVSGKWFAIASFTQATGVTNERILSPGPANNGAPYVGGLPGRRYRAAYAIGGGTPSFDFTVSFAGSGK